jgi:hypothetical protein
MKVNIITANEVIETGTISYGFIFDSKSDYSNHQKVSKWGAVLKSKDCNGVLINIFESGTGLVFGWGNDSFEDESWLSELLSKMPASTLLLDSKKAEFLKQFCEKKEIEFAYHHYDGILYTG